MSVYNLFIYFFGLLSLILGIMVITRKNAVHSAIYLIFCILSIAGLYFMLQADFLGAVQIIIYAGGIMVIYVFIILLIKLEVVKGLKRVMGIRIFTALIFIALLSEMSYLLLRKKFPPLRPGQPVTEGNIQAVGSLLFKDYLIPFEVASLLLLVAMIGAIILSRKRA